MNKAQLNEVIQAAVRERDDAREAAMQLRAHLQGSNLITYLLLKRVGGEVLFTDEEIAAASGARLKVSEQPTGWSITAIDPEPAEASIVH